jgi:hypothetical protein
MCKQTNIFFDVEKSVLSHAIEGHAIEKIYRRMKTPSKNIADFVIKK